MRTLLVISYYFPPTAAVASHRVLGFVRYLPAHGWRCVVVAPPAMPYEPIDLGLTREIPGETVVVRVPFPRGIFGTIAGRLAHQESWQPGAWKVCRRLLKEFEPDAFLTTSPPPCIHFLGLYLKRRSGLPWIADLRDPWRANSLATLKPPFLHRFNQRFEPMVMDRADAVIANTPLNLTGLQAAYPTDAARMTMITNGFDPERFPKEDRIIHSGRPLTILYAGELYGGRDPRPLFDALQGLRQHPDMPVWRLRFVGRATDSGFDWTGEVRRRGLSENVEFTDQVSYAQALEKMVAADILLLIHRRGAPVGVQAKLYEYLGANRPVLALAEQEGDIAWALRESGVVHRVAPTDDVPAIQRALLELSQVARTERRTSGNNLSQFTREHLTAQLAQCLDRIAPEKAKEAETDDRAVVFPRLANVGLPSPMLTVPSSVKRTV